MFDEQIRRVQLEGGENRQQRAEQQPGDRRSVKHQHGHARRGVDQRALDLFDVADAQIGHAAWVF